MHLWDSATGKHVQTLGPHTGGVIRLAFEPQTKLIAVGCRDGMVKLWRLDSGSEVGPITAHKSYVNGLSFSPDGSVLASCSSDGKMKLWRCADGSPAGEFELPLHEEVAFPEFSRDGKQLVITTNEKVILLDAKSLRVIREFRGHRGFVYSAHFSPNGQHLATSGYDRSVKIWDVATGRLLADLNGQPMGRTEVQWITDTSLLSNSGTTVRILDSKHPPMGEEQFTTSPTLKDKDSIYYPGSERVLAAFIENGSVKIDDALSGAQVATLTPEPVYQWGKGQTPIRSIVIVNVTGTRGEVVKKGWQEKQFQQFCDLSLQHLKSCRHYKSKLHSNR